MVGATVTDVMPAAIASDNFTAVGSGGASGFTAAGAGNINDTVSMPAGSTITYTVVADISAGATGNLVNTATATVPAGVTDTNPANNSATDTDALAAQADLSITKSDGAISAAPGTATTYTIVVANNGPSDVVGATVSDILPAAIASDNFTAVGSGGASGFTAAGAGNINDTVNMPSGSTITYTVVANISAGATGNLVNTATVTPPAGVTETNPGNNSATDTDTLAATADLSITKTDGVVAIAQGGSTTYVIVVANGGPSAVVGATVSDILPAAFAGATFTAVGSGGASGFTANGGGNINDTVNMPAGSTITYTVTASLNAGALGIVSNTATVTAPGGVTDPAPGEQQRHGHRHDHGHSDRRSRHHEVRWQPDVHAGFDGDVHDRRQQRRTGGRAWSDRHRHAPRGDRRGHLDVRRRRRRNLSARRSREHQRQRQSARRRQRHVHAHRQCRGRGHRQSREYRDDRSSSGHRGSQSGQQQRDRHRCARSRSRVGHHQDRRQRHVYAGRHGEPTRSP